MTPKPLAVLLGLGIAAGIFSLPARWVTYHPARGGPLSLTNWFTSTLGDPTIIVTGIDGRVFVPVDAPLWLIVSVPIGTSAIRLIQLQIASTVRTGLVKCSAVVGAIWVTLVFLLMLVGERNNLGMGGFLALLCAALTVIGSFQQTEALRFPRV